MRGFLTLFSLLLFAAAGFAEEADTLWIESQAVPERPYVQQQVVYTQRLYRRSHLQRGYFAKPAVPDAILKALPADEPVRVMREGVEFERLERRYLLFPQRSGRLALPAPVFSSRDLFVKGEPLALTVRPKPAGAGLSHWMVADDVRVADEWRLPDRPLQIGDLLERIISIEADGVTGAQLPSPALTRVEGLRVRPIDESVAESMTQGVLTGRRVVRRLYVATTGGRFEIPPETVEWWSRRGDMPARSVLAGRVLEVSDAGGKFQSLPDTAAEPATLPADEPPSPSESVWPTQLFYWLAIPAALAACWSLLPLRAIGRFFFNVSVSWHLLVACRRGDANAVNALLKRWAVRNRRLSGPFSLPALAALSDDRSVRRTLNDLDRSLYARKPIGAALACRPLWRLLWRSANGPDAAKSRVLPALWESL